MKKKKQILKWFFQNQIWAMKRWTKNFWKIAFRKRMRQTKMKMIMITDDEERKEYCKSQGVQKVMRKLTTGLTIAIVKEKVRNVQACVWEAVSDTKGRQQKCCTQKKRAQQQRKRHQRLLNATTHTPTQAKCRVRKWRTSIEQQQHPFVWRTIGSGSNLV